MEAVVHLDRPPAMPSQSQMSYARTAGLHGRPSQNQERDVRSYKSSSQQHIPVSSHNPGPYSTVPASNYNPMRYIHPAPYAPQPGATPVQYRESIYPSSRSTTNLVSERGQNVEFLRNEQIKPRISLLPSNEYLSLSRNRLHQSEGFRDPITGPPPQGSEAPLKKIRLGEPKPDIQRNLRVDTRDDSQPASTYNPQVEAISPTLPSEALQEESNFRSTKDDLLHGIAKVDREITKTELQISKLKRKQQELEENAKKPATTKEEEEIPQPKHQSPAQKIYAENRKKAQDAHNLLANLGPKIHLPLYNQPSDTAVYHENKKRHMVFRKRLLEHLRKKHIERENREKRLTTTYSKMVQDWLKKVEKIENSQKRKAKEAKNREYFEKIFPKLRKQREDRERFNRVGSRVKSEADIEEIMDGLQEQEMEDKKMRSYAVVPPLLLDGKQRSIYYVNNNGRLDDFAADYKEKQLLNVWTQSEKEIFKEKFLQHPKNFGIIASYLERKSVCDCVQYYYLSKKTENYKRLLRKSRQRPRSRNPQSKVNSGSVANANLDILATASGVTTRLQREQLQKQEPMSASVPPDCDSSFLLEPQPPPLLLPSEVKPEKKKDEQKEDKKKKEEEESTDEESMDQLAETQRQSATEGKKLGRPRPQLPSVPTKSSAPRKTSRATKTSGKNISSRRYKSTELLEPIKTLKSEGPREPIVLKIDRNLWESQLTFFKYSDEHVNLRKSSCPPKSLKPFISADQPEPSNMDISSDQPEPSNMDKSPDPRQPSKMDKSSDQPQPSNINKSLKSSESLKSHKSKVKPSGQSQRLTFYSILKPCTYFNTHKDSVSPATLKQLDPPDAKLLESLQANKSTDSSEHLRATKTSGPPERAMVVKSTGTPLNFIKPKASCPPALLKTIKSSFLHAHFKAQKASEMIYTILKPRLFFETQEASGPHEMPYKSPVSAETSNETSGASKSFTPHKPSGQADHLKPSKASGSHEQLKQLKSSDPSALLKGRKYSGSPQTLSGSSGPIKRRKTSDSAERVMILKSTGAHLHFITPKASCPPALLKTIKSSSPPSHFKAQKVSQTPAFLKLYRILKPRVFLKTQEASGPPEMSYKSLVSAETLTPSESLGQPEPSNLVNFSEYNEGTHSNETSGASESFTPHKPFTEPSKASRSPEQLKQLKSSDPSALLKGRKYSGSPQAVSGSSGRIKRRKTSGSAERIMCHLPLQSVCKAFLMNRDMPSAP